MEVPLDRANGSIPTIHQTHASLQGFTGLPEKEELEISVNQMPYDQTHLRELCEKREGCK